MTTTLRVGSMTSLAPVCITLEVVKKELEKVWGCKKRLKEIHHKCELITTYVILQDDVDQSQSHMAHLKTLVDELNNLVHGYADRGRFVTYLHLLADGKIDRLEHDLDTFLSVMNLAASSRTATAAIDWRKRVDSMVSAKVLSSNGSVTPVSRDP